MIKIVTTSLLVICLINTVHGQAFVEKVLPGIEALSNNNGIAVADYNLDGHLDFFVVATEKYDSRNPSTWSRLFKNNNDATFSDVTTISGLEGSYDHDFDSPPNISEFLVGKLRYGASWGDYDNDGYPDLFLTNYKFNKLYHNNTDGTFTERIEEAGLNHGADCHSTSAMWFDYNLDGYLDLLFTLWASCEDNKLYENNGDGTFKDVSAKIATPLKDYSWLAIPVDANEDGWPDILFVNDFQSNMLLINNEGVFLDETTSRGLLTTDLRNQMGATYADVNHDGTLDVYISDINKNALWLNDNGQFSDFAESFNIDSTDWSWQTQFRDMDLDGDQDIVIVIGLSQWYNDYYLRNDLEGNSMAFTDMSMESGFGARKSISTCFESFDYDHDGDLDVLRTQLIDAPYFQENSSITNVDDSSNPNWVKIALEGTTSNRSAIGTKVRLTTPNGQTQYYYYSGVGFMSQSLQPVLFGLGDQTEVTNIEVTWPNGLVENFKDIEINSLLKFREGNGYTAHYPVSNKISGCTDVNSCSFNPIATTDDGSCQYLETYSISGVTSSGIYRYETYTYPVTNGNSVNWSVEGGELVSGQGESNAVIQWGIGSEGRITVTEIGECYSEESELEILLQPGMYNRDFSVARLWNEALLEAIRSDYARPTVHARNLFHSSVLLHDIYALYTKKGKTYLEYDDLISVEAIIKLFGEQDLEREIEVAISHAMAQFMNYRFDDSPGNIQTDALVDNLMLQLQLNPSYSDVQLYGGGSADIGIYVARTMIEYGMEDGAKEQIDYANLFYEPVNSPLLLELPGNENCEDPNRWQPLQFIEFIDQSGNFVNASTPEFLGAEWGRVKPFALQEFDRESYLREGVFYEVFHNPGAPPYLGDINAGTDAFYKWGFSLVSIWGSHLDPSDGILWDVSPKTIGNIDESLFPDSWQDFESFYTLIGGGDIGMGRSINPVTNKMYDSQIVPRGDYARVLAEFWADGPNSETPPGHWFTILNYVSDHPVLEKRFGGEGDVISDLEWDIRAYFTLGGAMHDAAIAAWSVKGWYDYIRPISAIRYMAGKGQSSDSQLDNYHVEGIPLLPGFVELVAEDDPLAGVEGENVGKIKLYSWKGHDYINDPSEDVAGVGWILAENWWPYQRPSFVTPPFAGYVSGHSTFSRAAAEILTHITGSEYFPDGLGEFVAKKNEFLVFEQGPSVDVKLQWATYFDASDQCSLSRIWGGIHPPADDIPGRIIGTKVGRDAYQLAKEYFISETVVSSLPKIPNSVYPNPVTSKDMITVRQMKPHIKLLDLNGKSVPIEVKKNGKHSGQIKIMKEVPSGIYILTIGTDMFKVVIQD